MRERGQWRLSDLQRLFLALAVASAVFLSAMALGMGSFGLLLVALLLLVATGLAVFLLGLWYSNRTVVQGGTAYVIMASPPPSGSIVGRCDMRLLIDLADGGSKMVKLRDPSVSVTKWPHPGSVLPIEVDERNPRTIRVRWDRVDPNQPRSSMDVTAPFHTEYAQDIDEAPLDDVYAGPTPPTQRPLALTATPTPPIIVPDQPLAQEPVIIEDYVPDDLADLVGDDVAEYRVDGDESPYPSDGPIPGAGRPWIAPAEEDPLDEEPVGEDPLAEVGPSEAELGDARARAADYELPARSSIPQPRPSEPVVPERPVEPVAEATGGHAAGAGNAPRPGMGIMLVVSDLNRSLTFYRDTLEFDVVDHAPGGAVLAYGGGRLVLRPQADMSPVDRRVIHLHIEVPDVESAYQDLKSKGVDFVHRPRVLSRGDKLELWAARFRDPDGHGIALTQWRDRQEAR